MKATLLITGFLAVGLLTFAGCGKSESPGAPVAGVQVIDATKFRPAFAGAAPETQALVDKVMTGIQGTMYADSLAALDKLANTPSLTDPQKKQVANLTDQLKRKMAAAKP